VSGLAPRALRNIVRPRFQCPHCGLHRFGAHALVRPSGFRHGRSLVPFCFWCPGCNRYSALAHPILLVLAYLMVAAALFILMYHYFEPLGWLILGPATILGIVGSFAAVPVLTRLLNRYVPLDRSAGL
jgi:hypothetical protein